MSDRIWVSLTNGNVVDGYVKPKADIIETLENATVRRFSSLTDHVEVEDVSTANTVVSQKYDSSAETDTVKTSASFESAGTDSKGNARWWDNATGNKMQYTYDENDVINGSEQVS